MAFSNTAEAIGAITELLKEYLHTKTSLDIYAGRPSQTSKRLNLFLYEAVFDASMKNLSLDQGQNPPLWLVLKYILTAYDADNDSDSADAHKELGKGIMALQEMSFLTMSDSLPEFIRLPLKDNPEELKITFEEVPADLISKIMQGQDEKYRFSMGFQIRPVLIIPDTIPAYNLLVGVDYTTPIPTITGEEGIELQISGSLGPHLDKVDPERFEPGATITLTGSDLNLENCQVLLGGQPLALSLPAKTDSLSCLVNIPLAPPVISAGEHTVTVAQSLSATRKRFSNLLVAKLQPMVSNVLPFLPEATEPLKYYGRLKISGQLLGTAKDDVFVALYQNGETIRLFAEFEEFQVSPPLAGQNQLTVRIAKRDQPPAGTYLVIVRVNGQQARKSYPVVLP